MGDAPTGIMAIAPQFLAELACSIAARAAAPAVTVAELVAISSPNIDAVASLDMELQLEALFQSVDGVAAPDGRKLVSKGLARNGSTIWTVTL